MSTKRSGWRSSGCSASPQGLNDILRDQAEGRLSILAGRFQSLDQCLFGFTARDVLDRHAGEIFLDRILAA